MQKPVDVSIVIPLLNEEDSLLKLNDWIFKVLKNQSLSFEIIYIDDGSTDKSWEIIKELHKNEWGAILGEGPFQVVLEGSDEEEFKALEVAEKLKLQLKKLELIRLLSDQMLKRKRLGRDVFMRGIKGKIKSIYNAKYSLTLYELLKSYSSIIVQKDFLTMNIPKLPVLTTEDGIKRIKEFFGKLGIKIIIRKNCGGITNRSFAFVFDTIAQYLF